jgi:uncharacterized membrane protein
MKKSKKQIDFQKYFTEEYIFAVVALIFGLIFSFVNPPFQSNDEDRHFYKAYMLSEGKFFGEKQGGNVGFMMPNSVYTVANAYQGINFNSGQKIATKVIENYSEVKLNPDSRFFYKHTAHDYNPIAFLPNTIGILFGKVIDSNPMNLLWSARIFGVLFYVVIVFFAIRIIPVHKGVLMLFALSPMSVYISASVSYDVTTLSLAYLMIALIVNLALKKDKLSNKEFLLLLVVAFFHRFAKDNYWILGFLVLIIPPRKFKTYFHYAAMIIYVILLIKMPSILWKQLFVPAYLAEGVALLQTDFVFNTGMNFSYHLGHPIDTIKDLFMNVLFQGKDWMYGAFGRFGYAYFIPSGFIFTIHIIIIFTVALYDNNKTIILPTFVRYFTLGLGLFFLLAITGGYFLVGSPVGSNVVFGLQGRYFTPILPLFTFSLYNLYFSNKLFDKYKSLIVGAYATILLTIIAFYINGYFYA